MSENPKAVRKHTHICAKCEALKELLRAAGREGLLIEDEVERNLAEVERLNDG